MLFYLTCELFSSQYPNTMALVFEDKDHTAEVHWGTCMTSPALSCSLPTRRTSERAPEQAPGKHLLHCLPLYHKKLYNIRQQDRNRYETPRTFRYQTSLVIPMQVSDWAAGKTSSPAQCQRSAVLAGQEVWPQSHPRVGFCHLSKVCISRSATSSLL